MKITRRQLRKLIVESLFVDRLYVQGQEPGFTIMSPAGYTLKDLKDVFAADPSRFAKKYGLSHPLAEEFLSLTHFAGRGTRNWLDFRDKLMYIANPRNVNPTAPFDPQQKFAQDLMYGLQNVHDYMARNPDIIPSKKGRQ